MSRKDQIISYIRDSLTPVSSSDIHTFLMKQEDLSLVTVKRELANIESEGLIESVGAGRSTAYRITTRGRLLSDVDMSTYASTEPDKRNGLNIFNFELFKGLNFDPFTDKEKRILDDATSEYRRRIDGQTQVLHEKELERFVIELSWKSSRIEGNTYTLLDTERLIREGIPGKNNTPDETAMILNHKEAFKYIYVHKDTFKELSRVNIENIHSLLVKDLNVSRGFRARPVGVTGSAYIPLDNQFQIIEAVDELVACVQSMPHAYAKSLVAVLGLSYIQPFEDGNKRTSRLIANALLMSHGYAPLSYRSVDENAYRESVLVFYELNSVVPFKKLFIDQYDFAARNYLL